MKASPPADPKPYLLVLNGTSQLMKLSPAVHYLGFQRQIGIILKEEDLSQHLRTPAPELVILPSETGRLYAVLVDIKS